MYFSFFKLKKWGKKTAAARRHNCAVLPLLTQLSCRCGIEEIPIDKRG